MNIANTLDKLDNRDYNKITVTRLSRSGGANMARARFKTLTEQMFYILLCMKEECRGMDILETVRNMTGGRVNIGSGTLYDLLEQFVEEEIIAETRTEGRRRSYIITEKGKAMLAGEYERLRRQAADYNMIFGGEQNK